MKSKVLFDTRDLKIKRIQPEPKGSANLPSFSGICKSARIPENEKEYMDTLIIEDEYLTDKGKKVLRVLEVDNEVKAVKNLK